MHDSPAGDNSLHLADEGVRIAPEGWESASWRAAVQVKVLITRAAGTLEEEVNAWLSENASITVNTVKQSAIETDNGPLCVILTIFYTED